MMPKIVIGILRGYQVAVSPLKWLLPAPPVAGGCCRFHPSCSQYAIEAVQAHGARRGLWMAAKRVGRCHPWHEGGFDPVPKA
jgi:putative membrane protein insertion efficiency factor